MITVVIPLYNKAGLIGRTIKSVLDQSYQDFEIVVVDDGSTDSSSAEVEAIADPRIRIIRQENAGVSAARNRGIAEAKGDLIALLDGDDTWETEYLQTQYDLSLAYPDCDIFICNYKFIDPKGKEIPSIINGLPFEGEHGRLDNYFTVATCSHPPITAISIMTRQGVFESVGGFPLGIKSGEDLLTWARLACRYNMAFSRRPLAVYNLGAGYDFANKPPRRQDPGDPVGRGLKLLLEESSQPGLKHYIGHWHKMRASVAIRYFSRMETLKEALVSLRYYPGNKKILPFLLMPLLPSLLLRRLFTAHANRRLGD